MTVQIRYVKTADIDEEVGKARTILEGFPGIATVDVLDAAAGAKLLEPWLGTSSLEGLPVPRLIRVIADESSPPDISALEQDLSQVQGVHLDTHRKWEAELTRMARALSVLSSAILVLISISAVAIVIFATRAVLQANRHIVDLLHLVGARDSYIARQIDGRFLRSGLVSGFIGVVMGLLTFFGLSTTGFGGNGGFAAASRGLLFAPPDIAVWSYGLLFAVPIAATLICLITSRLTLIRRLGGVV
jgi:cell division transport system permease protein